MQYILGEYQAKMCAANSASAIRLKIESALSPRIASALTPPPRIMRQVAATGIDSLDIALHGGLPVGAISEFAGPECSGRTAVALSFLAQSTRNGKICAWIDVSNALDSISAAGAGVDLDRLLWVRCGTKDVDIHEKHNFTLPKKYFIAPPVKRGLHGGGFGAHPRSELKGLPDAVSDLLKVDSVASRYEEPQIGNPPDHSASERNSRGTMFYQPQTSLAAKPWSRIEQALRATDLLLQSGGFSAIVLDLGGLSPDVVSRIPLATWFRYRAATEKTQSSIVLLTQYNSAKSSVGLLLQFHPTQPLCDEATVFTGIHPSIEIVRRRFAINDEVEVHALRKSPQSTHNISWRSQAVWTVYR